MLRDVARISVEIAQTVVAEDEQGRRLPVWLLVEVAPDLTWLTDRESRP